MSSDIISCLQLDKKLESGRVIVAKEIKGCDSTFLTSCVIGHAIKNKYPMLLILTHNSLSHYQNVGLRMFYNLKNSIGCGLIDVYDFTEECNNTLLNKECTSLRDIFCKLEVKISQLQLNGPVNVIFDGVSHMFDLQYTLRDVNHFCKQIVKVANNSNSFVIFHCSVASEDDVTWVMSSSLCHMAHTVVKVETLASGWSTDVSGHLQITYTERRFDDKFMFALDLKPSQYLFKLFDKGVKLFAPGTI